MTTPTPLPPGATIGILGGGQLGRMAAEAAARLGYRTHIYTPEADSPAAAVSSAVTVAAWDDLQALERFAAAVDVVTLEFENVPVETVERLEAFRPVRPDSKSLAVAQDRVVEKGFADWLGLRTAPWQSVSTARHLASAYDALGPDVILKTRRLGYDGRGQVRIGPGQDLAAAWKQLKGAPAIVEGVVPFVRELSLVLARGLDGEIAFYPLVENTHEAGILRQTTAPAPNLDPGLVAHAQRLGRIIASSLEYVGVLAIELFETSDGQLLINELAPRTHNSGHWTLDAAATSQFEQQIRAVAGLPLGAIDPVRPAVMTNLLGAEIEHAARYAAEPQTFVHLYGKRDARPGRKMGHVTRLV